MYTRILVAIDSSDTAKKALAEAIHIAAAFKARLCIAHALDEGLLAQHALGIGTYLDADKIKVEMRQVAHDLLGGAVTAALAGGAEAESRLIESEKKRTAEQIAEAARDWQADLIVVGTHGRHGVERLLVGSVAENLTRLATTSLLMVR
jgi:nucleotide-binding universal stress UspA family protein